MGQWSFLLQDAHFFACFVEFQIATIKQLVGFFQGSNGLWRIVAPAKPFRIDAYRTKRIARTDEIRRCILAHGAGATYHGVVADAYKLMDGAEASKDCPVADMHVPAKLHAIGNDGMVRDLAIVRDMRIRHDPVIIQNARNTGILRGTGIDGDVLAHRIAIPYFEPGWFATVFLILRHSAYRAEPVEIIIDAYGRVAVYHAVRAYYRTLAYRYMFADDAERTYADIVGNDCSVSDYCRGVYQTGHC